MTLGTPISFTLYDKDDQIISEYSRARIELTFIERASEFEENFGTDTRKLTKEQSLILCQFVADFYGNRFTAEEAHAGADMMELMAVLQSIITRVAEVMPKQANPFVPRKRSRQRQKQAKQ